MMIQAPTGGWNAISSLAEMPPQDAYRLDNLIPDSESVRSRRGHAAHTTTARTNARTLVSFNGATPKLLLGGAGNIYDVTATGAGTDLTSGLSAFTNNEWHTNGYKDKIIFCNGADYPVIYDAAISVIDIDGPLGADLAVNGGFSADSDWTKGTGWSIGSGVASSDASQTSDSDLVNTGIALEATKKYSVTFTVSGRTAGNVTAVVGNTEGTDRSTNATFTEIITAANTDPLTIRADADFDGDIDDVSIQLVSVDDFIGSVTFKGRVFYWEKPAGNNPRSFWYASAGAYQGTLTEFALSEFAKTGYVVACAEWTRDGGEGMDDYFVVLMSTGETLIYSGSDPGDPTDWFLVGIFRIGEPIGIKPVTQVGSDLIVITKDGYVVLSAALGGGRYTEESLFSYKINTAAARAARDYGDNFGWEATLFSEDSLFVVNVPLSATQSHQYVRNTTTGAWCRFTGMNAKAFAAHDGVLYFAAADGYVYRYQGSSDDGGFIPMRADQAYNALGAPHIKKQITAVKVFSNYALPRYLHSTISVDFDEQNLTSIGDPPEANPGDWDVGEWDVAEWDAAAGGTKVSMKPIQAYGFFLSHTLRLRSRAQRFIWYATQLVVKKGGIV